jgi:choline-sulfatase
LSRVRRLAPLLVLATAAACGSRGQLADDAPDLLLVSIDTLRYDAVRGGGRMRATTPHLDDLFAKGVAIDDAHAHVPLTLPSHATAFTGCLPPALALHDNAPFPLRRDVPTLATIFSAAGYATAAVIGGQPLAEGCGLERGFERYDSPPRARGGAALFGERDAKAVTDAALKIVADRAGGRRRLLFVHYFDCHQPYDPPREYLSGDPNDPIDRYRGEVAFVDHEFGRLIDALRTGRRRWLVALFADHGEGLGDHGELTHGYQVFESTMHVPLLFVEIEGEAARRPASLAAIDGSGRLAGLCDLFPTVLRCVGLALPEGISGRPLQEPAARATSYVESLAASLQFGWAQVTGVRAREATLLHAGAGVPDDLGGVVSIATGGLDERTLVAPGRAAPDEQELASWREEWSADRTARVAGGDAPAAARDRAFVAIGYLAASRDPRRHALRPVEENAALASPLARGEEIRDLLSGVAALERGDARTAALAFDRILARDPDQRAALLHRARARLALDDGSGTSSRAATADLERLVGLEPDYPGARLLLAKGYGLEGRFDEAFAAAEQAAGSEPAAEVGRLLGSLHLTRSGRGRENPRYDREKGVNDWIRSVELDPSQVDLASRVDDLLRSLALEQPPPDWLDEAEARWRRRRGRRYPLPRAGYLWADRRFRASGGVVTRRRRRRPARRNGFAGRPRAAMPA